MAGPPDPNPAAGAVDVVVIGNGTDGVCRGSAVPAPDALKGKVCARGRSHAPSGLVTVPGKLRLVHGFGTAKLTAIVRA